MKKVKVMLTAIAVLAVVGGALAFKANTFGGTRLFICDQDQQQCKIFDANNSYTTIGGVLEFASATVTAQNPGNTPCTEACSSTVTVTLE
jgi:hypothetical protein